MKTLRPAAVILFVTILAATLAATLAAAQQDAAPNVDRAQQGAYLVDQEGNSLYLYLEDDRDASSCTDQCAENWPPVTVDGDPTVGDRLIDAYVGTVEREDGSTQLTYGGWPLYRYAHDDEPGETFGHGLGDVFYLVSPSGTRIEGDVPEDEEEDAESQDADDGEGDEEDGEEGDGEGDEADGDDAAADPRMEQGQQVFARHCTACHGAEGEGLVGPGFAGNTVLDSENTVVTTILHGRPDHGMPAFADQLDDEQVAAVATYIRNAWGNDFGPVMPEAVSERR